MGKVLIWFVIIISTVVLYCLMKVKAESDELYLDKVFYAENNVVNQIINVIQIRFFMMKTVYHMRSCIENTVQLRNAVFFWCTNAQKAGV